MITVKTTTDISEFISNPRTIAVTTETGQTFLSGNRFYTLDEVETLRPAERLFIIRHEGEIKAVTLSGLLILAPKAKIIGTFEIYG